MSLIFFDMEGPLSTHDNIRALMKLIPNGSDILEVIRRYDRQRSTADDDYYDPGDELALIAPFLIFRSVTSETIANLADDAAIVDGAIDLIRSLSGWQVFCISTSYEQYAGRITERVGISGDHVACTAFPLERIKALATEEDYSRIAAFESEMLDMQSADDKAIKSRLERFFREELVQTDFGKAVRGIKPMGGRKKAAALRNFARIRGVLPEQCVVIGDGVTDSRMLESVHIPGGLSIAFNGNEHALPYATIGLASTDICDLKPALDAWPEGGRDAVKRFVESQSGLNRFQWLADAPDFEEALQTHLDARQRVRGAAGLD
ncbi:MAG: hypothetical protein U9N44_03685 [Chloroflexota bacterium]|nr:hypothetical protein [Chloroflexota bacterium]